MANMASAPSGAAGVSARWDTAYEFKAVILLTVGFGLVGLDRWILPPLFAAQMGKDLGLTPQDLGNLVGALGVAWGVSAIFMGGLSDRIGRRKVLVPAVVLFSVLSALSGMATGLLSLLLIRIIMGVSEGAVAPTGVATAVEASHPKRRGMNNGLFQCAFALFGLAVAPILATQLLQVTSWRNVFMIVGIPGLIVAGLMWLTIRDPVTVGGRDKDAPRAPFSAMFRHRNVPLAMLGLLCAMAGIFVISSMMPSYLTGEHSFLHLSPIEMGFVTSAIGFGGFLGQLGVPALSDYIGRRLTCLISFAVAAVFLWLFIHTGANLPLLFALLFVASLANFGALALIAGPMAAEAAPLGLIASVAGIVIGAGEIFGGGVAPAIAGGIAQTYGIQYTLYFAMGGQLLGILVSLFFRETAPRMAATSRSGEVSALDVFEVAATSAAYERVAVAKNFEYVIEAARAEGVSGWCICAHDEFALCMDGEIEVHLVKLQDASAVVDPQSQGAYALEDPPQGRKMGRLVLQRGHMGLLPSGAAYRFQADVPSVMMIQTKLGPVTVQKWAEICQTD